MNKPTFTDHRGDVFHRYNATYKFDGAAWSLEFWARSPEEAIEKLRAIRTTAVECRCIEGVINGPFAGLRVRLTCWFRNLFGIE